MAVLKRSEAKPPVLPKETVTVPSLGGEVVVRGLLLSERLATSSVQRKLMEPKPGETEDEAHARAGASNVPRTLHQCVLLADGKPLYSARQWEEFGATHPTDALMLFGVAMRLSGEDLAAVEKNS